MVVLAVIIVAMLALVATGTPAASQIVVTVPVVTDTQDVSETGTVTHSLSS